MSVTPQQFSDEETVSLICERAKVLTETGNPALFDLMLLRRDKSGGLPNTIASFSQVTLEQIQDPMRWVPMLCGGGEYLMNVRHASTPGRLGGPIKFSASTEGPGMQPRAPNPLVTLRADWQGPSKINSPSLPDPVAAQVQQNGNGATATGMQMMGGYNLPIPTPQPQQGQSDRERELQQQLADMKANQARMDAEAKAASALEAVKRDSDARIREAELRADTARREGDQRMRELEAKISVITNAPPAAPKTDALTIVSQLFGLFSPILTQLMQQMHESKQAMLKMNEDQNRRQLEANEKQHQAQMEMLRAVTAKPSGMSDEMKMLIETLRAQANSNGTEGQAMMLTRMSEAMGIVTKSSMAMVESAVDALGGEPDHPAVIAIREGVGALTALMKGQNEAAMKTVKKAPPQLPAGQRMPNIPGTNIPMTPSQVQILRQQHAARVAQQNAAVAAGKQPQNGQNGQNGQQKPQVQQPRPPGPVAVKVSTPPPQQPAQVIVPLDTAPAAPVPVEAAIIQPLGITADGFPEAVEGTGFSHFQVLTEGVRAMKDINEVSDYFVKLVKEHEPSMRAQLDACGGSPFKLVVSMVGAEFIDANQVYFKDLGQTVDAKATAAGVWNEASEEDMDADEADEDEGTAPEVALEADPVPTA